MAIFSIRRSSNRPAAREEARSETQGAAPQPAPDRLGPLGALKQRAARLTATSSHTAGTSPLAWSRMNAGGPAMPDVRGPARTVSRPPQGTVMSGRKLDGVNAKLGEVKAALHPVDRPSASVGRLPETAVALCDEAACEGAIRRLFGPGAGALAQATMAAAPASTEAGYTHEPALTLASALHAVVGGDEHAALALLDAARSPQRPTGALRGQLARLHRVLASGHAGLGVLCHLEGVTDPGQQEALGEAMRMVTELAARGMDPDGPSLLGDLVAAIDTPAARASWLSRPVGGDDDPPQQLLSQALLHAHARLRGEAPADPAYKRAHVAWKLGGFTESGAGTDFNNAIERLNKFAVYGERGDHGPRTAGKLARETGDAFAKVIGHRKSPISQMRHGAMGGDRIMLDIEADKFRAALDEAIAPLATHLRRQLDDSAVRNDVQRMSVLAGRLATLEQWGELGRKSVRVDAQDVLRRANRLHLQMGRPGAPQLDQQAILRDLKVPTKLRKGGAPGRSPQGPGLKLHLQVLEDWGADALREADAAAPDALRALPQQVEKARSIAKGREQTNPLFEWRDVGNMITGKPARMGPTLGDARRVALQAAQGRYESTTRFSDGGGGGIDVHAVLALKSGHGAAAVPALRAEAAKTANVSIGLSLTGGRFFVGTEAPKGVGVGLTGALGVPLPKDAGVGAAFVEAAIGRDWSEGQGACITTRSDVPGWEAKGADVVNFMFDHAEGPRKSAGEFWGDFVDRFGDDPHVGISWVSDHSRSTTAALGAGATVRGNVGNGMSIGPSLSASLRYTRESSGRAVAGDGADVPFEARASRLTAGASAALAQATPAVTPSEGGVSGLLNVLPLVGFGAEKVLSGKGAIFRLGRERDGRLSPSQCQQERQFRSRDDMIEFVNGVSARWETAMQGPWEARLGADGAAPGAGPRDGAAAMSAEDLHPRNRLHKFLHQVKNLDAQGNQTFGEFKALEPAVARRIDAYEDRMKTLLGTGDGGAARPPLASVRAECELLQNEVHRLLEDDASWKPVALYAIESNAKRSGLGWDWLLKVGSRGEAGATRLLALLVADKPDLAS